MSSVGCHFTHLILSPVKFILNRDEGMRGKGGWDQGE